VSSEPLDAHPEFLQHQFDTPEQQRESATLGMWLFLVTEIMFFGGFFLAYLVYRVQYQEAFFEASHHLNIVAGGINTAVLITSSLTMALAVWASQVGRRKATVVFMLLTMALGLVFLGIKAYEYHHKFVENLVPGPSFHWPGPHADHVEIFYSLYFGMTGLHALHMVIGVGVLAALLRPAWKGKYTPEYNTPVECFGLYWHFVDIVWIFLFPLLYLIGLHIK
jgi:cytochrome c oxidase subunit III